MQYIDINMHLSSTNTTILQVQYNSLHFSRKVFYKVL